MSDAELTPAQFQDFRRLLTTRREAVLADVRNALIQSDDEQHQALAGRVHDLADDSAADLLVDLNLATIDQYIQEVREIDAALLRISAQSYGICEDCGEPIPEARLEAYPTARRCRDCQEVYERTHIQKGHPGL